MRQWRLRRNWKRPLIRHINSDRNSVPQPLIPGFIEQRRCHFQILGVRGGYSCSGDPKSDSGAGRLAIKRPKYKCACAIFVHILLSPRHNSENLMFRRTCVQILHTVLIFEKRGGWAVVVSFKTSQANIDWSVTSDTPCHTAD